MEVSLLRALEDAVELRVNVIDSGIGIAEEAQGRLFQAFSQADSSTTRRHGGTGLGLAICRRLVNLMNGEIGVSSLAGKGSTFWFTVRLDLEAEKPGAKPVDAAEGDTPRILLIHPGDRTRGFLERTLRGMTARVDVASTSSEGLVRLQEGAHRGERYDFVLLDAGLPEMTGLALSRRIAARPELERGQLVLLSPPGRKPDVAELRVGGISACLAKPVRTCQWEQLLSQAIAPVARESSEPSGGQGRAEINGLAQASMAATHGKGSPTELAMRLGH